MSIEIGFNLATRQIRLPKSYGNRRRVLCHYIVLAE